MKLASTGTDDTWWWIKGDGCDVVKGVWESTKGEWSGDVDLNDGQLEYFHQQFKEQLQWTEGSGLKQRSSADSMRCDLQTALARLEVDLKFIHSGKHSM